MSLISIWDYHNNYNVHFRVPYKYIKFTFFSVLPPMTQEFELFIYLKACWFFLLPNQVWSPSLAINLPVQLFYFAMSRICCSYLQLWFLCWYFHFVHGLCYLFPCSLVSFMTHLMTDVLRQLHFCSLVVVSGTSSLPFEPCFSVLGVPYDLYLCVFGRNCVIWKH